MRIRFRGTRGSLATPGPEAIRSGGDPLRRQHHTYFPITLDQLEAKIVFHDLVEGVSRIGDAIVTTQYLHHPVLVLGYRIGADGVRVVHASDHEPRLPCRSGYRPPVARVIDMSRS